MKRSIELLSVSPEICLVDGNQLIPNLNIPQETIIKGYRVNVSYDSVTQDEMKRKRASVSQVVMNSLRRKK